MKVFKSNCPLNLMTGLLLTLVIFIMSDLQLLCYYTSSVPNWCDNTNLRGTNKNHLSKIGSYMSEMAYKSMGKVLLTNTEAKTSLVELNIQNFSC